MYESEDKAVAFHVMKPCIEFMQGFFFVLITQTSHFNKCLCILKIQ